MGATDYVEGIQYQNGAIDFIQTEEGRAVNMGGTYKYNLTNLPIAIGIGNVRFSLDIYNGNPRLLQQDDYYSYLVYVF